MTSKRPPRFDTFTNNFYCLETNTPAVKKIGVPVETNEFVIISFFQVKRSKVQIFWKFSLATVTNNSTIVTVS